MKTAKGMLAIAKAIAIDKGIRSLNNQGKMCGFSLKIDELNKIYAREGFPVHKPNYTIVNDHITTWKIAGQATQRGDMIFFFLNRGSFSDYQAEAQLQEYAKNHTNQVLEIYGFSEDDFI